MKYKHSVCIQNDILENYTKDDKKWKDWSRHWSNLVSSGCYAQSEMSISIE